MSLNNALEKERKRLEDIAVVRHGKKLIVPEGVSYKDAADALIMQQKFEEQNTQVVEEIQGYFPLDAAYMFYQTLKEQFGVVHQKVIEGGFFTPDRPPMMINVPISESETAQVPWGRLALVVLEGGHIDTQLKQSAHGVHFAISAIVKRKFADIIAEVVRETKRRLKTDSIYRGRALEVTWPVDEDNNLGIPEIRFLSNLDITEEDIILNEDVEEQIHTNLLAPIKYRDKCVEQGIPTKRGVLMAGNFGVGKSLIAKLVAKTAVDNGFTFVYVRNPQELFSAFDVTALYAPAVVFCEDIDAMISGERTDAMNRILNILDGVDTKNNDIITVLTTNNLGRINPAFLRPGRLDAVVVVAEPNAESAERLIRLYGRGLVSPNEDLSGVAEVLDGTIPAVIREVVEKAKLYQISLSKGMDASVLTAKSLLASSLQMTSQIDILKQASQSKKKSTFRTLGVMEEFDGAFASTKQVHVRENGNDELDV